MKHLKIEQSVTSAESVTLEQLSRLNEVVKGSALDTSSNLKGKLVASSAYIQDVNELMSRFADLQITVTGNQYVRFDDPVVREIVTANWDTNTDGYMTLQECAAVTNLGTLFRANADITSFDELKYFNLTTGLNTGTTQTNSAFMQCYALRSVTFPDSLRKVNIAAFFNCTSLSSVKNTKFITEIGNEAFYQTAVVDVNYPSLTTIGTRAFASCASLVSITSLGFIQSIPDGGLNNGTFVSCTSLTTANLPSTLTKIGNYAFYGCTLLKEIKLNNAAVTIGTNAFQACTSLASITGALNIKGIAANAFRGTSALEIDVNFPQLTSLGYTAFYYSGITSVSNLGTIQSIPANGTSNEGTFAGCSKLKRVTLPSTVTSVGRAAFSGCSSLEVVDLGGNVTSLSYNAFKSCPSIKILKGYYNVRSIDQGVFNSITAVASYYSSLKTVGDMLWLSLETIAASGTNWSGAFANCGMTSFIAPKLKSISGGGNTYARAAFEGCFNLSFVLVGEDVTSLGTYSFMNCKALKNFVCLATDPPSVNTAFHQCSALTSIFVPSASVETYKESWSAYESKIKGITEVSTLPDPLAENTLYHLSDGRFYMYDSEKPWKVYSVSDPYIPNGKIWVAVDSLDASVETHITHPWWYPLSWIVDGVEMSNSGAYKALSRGRHVIQFDNTSTSNPDTLKDYCFWQSEAAEIYLPDSITTINENAFRECHNLTLVEMMGVTTVKDQAFADTPHLEMPLRLPKLTKMGSSAFAGSGITSIEDLGTITEIPRGYGTPTSFGTAYGTFACCKNLVSVNLPKTVTFIGEQGFANNDAMTTVNLDSLPNLETIQQYAFQNCTSLTGIISLPKLTTLEERAFYKTSITRIEDLGKVTTIGAACFWACSSLVSVVLPSTLTTIGTEVFAYNGVLTEVTCYATTPPALGSDVFQGCSALTNIYVPVNSVSAYKTASGWSSFASKIQAIV